MYKRKKDGAALAKIVQDAGADSRRRWTPQQRMEIKATANDKWGEKWSSFVWRNRYAKAIGGLGQRVQKLEAAILAAMKRNKWKRVDVANTTDLTLNQLKYRMRGGVPWKDDEIRQVCRVLGIDASAHLKEPVEQLPLDSGPKTEHCPKCGDSGASSHLYGDTTITKCRCGHRWILGQGLPGNEAREKALTTEEGPPPQPPDPGTRPACSAITTVADVKASFELWCMDNIPAGIDPVQALYEIGVGLAEDPGQTARIRCAAQILQEQFDRWAKTGKWCDPYRIHVALGVLAGTTEPWDRRTEKKA